jgi:hypothetical protein
VINSLRLLALPQFRSPLRKFWTMDRLESSGASKLGGGGGAEVKNRNVHFLLYLNVKVLETVFHRNLFISIKSC